MNLRWIYLQCRAVLRSIRAVGAVPTILIAFQATALILLFWPLHGWCASYFVRADGNDNNSGTSHAQAWQTLNKVNISVSGKGDKVFLRCGDTWTSQNIRMVWDNAYVGAYYDDGADAGETSDDITWNFSSCGTRPVIDGNQSYPGPGEGLVELVGASPTVEYLKLYQSAWLHVATGGGSGGTVMHMVMDWSWKAALYAANYDDIEVAYCTVSRAGMIYPASCPPDCGYPGTITGYNSANAYFHNNKVTTSWGEGITSPGNNALIEYNIVFDNRSVGIYCSNTKGCIVRFNVVGGSDDTTYHNTNFGAWNGSGIDLNNELTTGIDNGKIYGNIVFRRGRGIGLLNKTNAVSDNIKVYNNILIENKNNLVAASGAVANFTNVDVKNNYSWTSNSNASHVAGNPDDPDWEVDYQYWDDSDPYEGQTAWVGTHDVRADKPGLHKSDGWFDISDLTEVALNKDFFLEPDSSAIGRALPLNEPYSYGILRGTDFEAYPIKVIIGKRGDKEIGWDFGPTINAKAKTRFNVDPIRLYKTP